MLPSDFAGLGDKRHKQLQEKVRKRPPSGTDRPSEQFSYLFHRFQRRSLLEHLHLNGKKTKENSETNPVRHVSQVVPKTRDSQGSSCGLITTAFS